MVARMRSWRLEDVVDGRRLRVQLSAAALDGIGDEKATRNRVLELLKGALFRGRLIGQERLEAGAGGLDTARLFSAVQDEVIAALYDYTTIHVFRARNPTMAERLAVCATGGYGRRTLAPSSDVDLLFLRGYRDAPWAESVTEYMLYMLWDMGLKVGHATRTIDETLREARNDWTIRTSVLETRHLVGEGSLTDDLKRRLRTELFANSAPDFVAAKLAERNDRHARTGASRYAVEPNIKDGKGGLRDLHTLFWIAQYVHGVENPSDFVRLGVFTRNEVGSFLRSMEFLWTVRCHLHLLTGRAEERLTFDLQPEMARRMGFGDRGDQAGVERFMKRYFLVAKEVGSLTRILCAKLEMDQQKLAPKGLSRWLASAPKRKKLTDVGFVDDGGRLSFVDADVPLNEPVAILRLFQIADDRNLDIHPDALSIVTRNLGKVGPGMRKDPQARAAFLAVAASRRNPAEALSLMNEAGVLGRFVPEFGRIVAQTQFNMYHHYTVDDHTLRAIQVISEIERGLCADEHPLATSVFPLIQSRRALYLAMLLHDTGKGHGDQQVEGAISARHACERLGLEEDERELVAWLVGHHLLMSDVAQRRDLSDPRTVSGFAETVGTLERLRLLLVLTVADIRAVGPGVWNDWKAQLLRDLYLLTEATFRGGRTDEVSVGRRLAEQANEARSRMITSPALATWLATLENAYWLGFTQNQHDWHAREIRAYLEDFPPFRIAARQDNQRGTTEVLVIALDRPGLFATLAAAFAAAGANVADARVFTTREGRALDIFALQDNHGMPFGADDPGRLNRLLAALQQAVPADAVLASAREAPTVKRAAAFSIQPWVAIDNDAAADDTVVEVSGRDRPGLLRDLALAFAESELTITSAHIDSVGERAADAFYVRDVRGGKLVDQKRISRLRSRLEKALSEHEPNAPTLIAKRSLAQARASSAR